MSEETSSKKSKIGGKLGGLGKEAIKQKAKGAISGAIKPATDAVLLDSTRLTPGEVTAKIIEMARVRGA